MKYFVLPLFILTIAGACLCAAPAPFEARIVRKPRLPIPSGCVLLWHPHYYVSEFHPGGAYWARGTHDPTVVYEGSWTYDGTTLTITERRVGQVDGSYHTFRLTDSAVRARLRSHQTFTLD